MKNILIAILLVGCGEQTGMLDAGAPDAAFVDAAMADAASPDAPFVMGTDAYVMPGTDAGSDVGSDAYVAIDAGSDAGVEQLDAWVATPDAHVVDVPAVVDAGPRRPLGRAVDVTGNDCGLDEAGAFWCWGSGSTVLFGDGFDQAQGSCAMRGNEVWCADPATTTMRPVMDGTALHMDSIAEYSDRAFGCGVHTVGGFGEVLCWTDNTVTIREGGGVNAVAVMAPGVRAWALSRRPALPLYFATANVEMFDANPTGICRTELVTHRTTCVPYASGPTFLSRADGVSAVLGFSTRCVFNAGTVTCTNGGTMTFPAAGFEDHAIFGSMTVIGSTITRTWGVCISGDDLRCYSGDGSYRTIDW